jgi:site-specific recombinase XerC
LIGSVSGDSARDIRDRAILMLPATCGLRSGEVAAYCLEDLNWESEIISISHPGSGEGTSTRWQTRSVSPFCYTSNRCGRAAHGGRYL